jgi:group I intron endonuclease
MRAPRPLRKTRGIYRLWNALDGKSYVGSGFLKQRRKSHFYALRRGNHGSIHLQRAFARDGEGVFLFVVIEVCNASDSQRLKREQFWIDKLDSANPKFGYNINPVAAKPPSQKGKKQSEKHRANRSAALKGAGKGRKLPLDTRRKQRVGQAEFWASPRGIEARKEQSKWARGKSRPEHSEAMKRRWADPKYKARLVASRLAFFKRPEGIAYKAQVSLQMRLRVVEQSAAVKKAWVEGRYDHVFNRKQPQPSM